MVGIATSYGKASVLEVIVKHFGEAPIKRNPMASELLAHPAHDKIESMCKQFHGLGHVQIDGANVMLAERRRNMVLEYPTIAEPVLSGDMMLDLPQLYTLARDSQRFKAVVEQLDDVAIFDELHTSKGEQDFSRYLDYLKKVSTEQNIPVRSAFMLTGNHFTHGAILVKAGANGPEAEMLYFDSLGINSDTV
jgi:hypothetical protein